MPGPPQSWWDAHWDIFPPFSHSSQTTVYLAHLKTVFHTRSWSFDSNYLETHKMYCWHPKYVLTCSCLKSPWQGTWGPKPQSEEKHKRIHTLRFSLWDQARQNCIFKDAYIRADYVKRMIAFTSSTYLLRGRKVFGKRMRREASEILAMFYSLNCMHILNVLLCIQVIFHNFKKPIKIYKEIKYLRNRIKCIVYDW